MMAIKIAGGAYCPLSPRNPEQRLSMLLEQSHSRIVLVDEASHDKFKGDAAILNMDTEINLDGTVDYVTLDRLSAIRVSPKSIAYVIFTSGSTGTPKAVCMNST